MDDINDNVLPGMSEEEREFLEHLEKCGVILCPMCDSEDTEYQATVYAKTGEIQSCYKCHPCGHEWTV
jgi:transposase-like protein